MNQIMLMLGLNPTGFRSGIKSAVDDTKQFEKGWKSFGKVLQGTGLALVIGMLKSMASEAADTRKKLTELGQPIPASTEALATLNDAFTLVSQGAASFVGTVLSGFKGIFDEAGSLINRIRGISEAQENAAMASAAAADAAEARLAAARAANSPEKILAAEKDLAAFRAKAALDAAEGQDKLTLLMRRQADLLAEMNSLNANTVRGIQARKEYEQASLDVAKQILQIHKDDTAAQQKAAEEHKAQLDAEWNMWWDNHERQEAAKAEAAAKELETAERLAAAEQRRLKIIEGQAEAARMTQKAYEAIMFGITNGGYDSSQIQNASDAELQQALSRNKAQLPTLKQNPGSAFDFGNSLTITKLENENARIQKELDLRNGLRSDVNFLGTEGARRQFTGDPLTFDRLVAQFVTTQTETGKTNQLLGTLVTKLSSNNSGYAKTSDPSLADQINRGFITLSQEIKAANQ